LAVKKILKCGTTLFLSLAKKNTVEAYPRTLISDSMIAPQAGRRRKRDDDHSHQSPSKKPKETGGRKSGQQLQQADKGKMISLPMNQFTSDWILGPVKMRSGDIALFF
jgi:hypothetical protein